MTKRLTLVLVLAVAAVTIPSLPAISACHRFFFRPTTYTVNESAGSVSVTVERDAAFAPSQVKVSTVDDSAKAGQDFAGFQNQTVVFGSETAKPVPITIRNDTSFEGTESFKVHLSEPGNAPPPNPPCPNQGFVISPADDATVTIQDNDPSPQSSPQPAGRTSPRTTPTASPTATVSPTLEATAESPLPLEASPTESPEAEAEEAVEEDGGTPIGLILAAVAGILVVGGGAFMFIRRRAAG